MSIMPIMPVLCYGHDVFSIPANIEVWKSTIVTIEKFGIVSKLARNTRIKLVTSWTHQSGVIGVFIINFEHIFQLSQWFLTLRK